MKLGILLAAYGSRNLKARESFTHIENRVKDNFPGVPVRWAFTSAALRHLAKGAVLEGAAHMLDKMAREGFSHVAVQSLHIVTGGEYRGLERTLAEWPDRADRAEPSPVPGSMTLGLGRPLLSGPDDIRRVAAAVFSRIPPGRTKDEAVVLMGHGTAGAGNELYGELLAAIRDRDANVFVGILGIQEDGPLSIESIKRELVRRRVSRAYLLPLLTVAGEHVRRDMAGDSPRSWKTILGSAGIACEPVMRGAAECDEFVDIWLDHLRSCVADLAGTGGAA